MTNCKPLIQPALETAFTHNVSITEDNGDCRVTVPFERADHDAITLWIKDRNDEFVISDEGETYGMLYLSNIDIEQERRARRVETVRKRYELDSASSEIALTTPKEHLGERLIDAIQAVQSISFLAYTRRQYSRSDFRADVGEYLTDHGYHYDRNVDIDGEAEQHRVDFNIHDGRPIYVEALHAENISTAHGIAQRTAYKWVDIHGALPSAVRISVIDDESGEVDETSETILRNYSDAFIPWSTRPTLLDTIEAAEA